MKKTKQNSGAGKFLNFNSAVPAACALAVLLGVGIYFALANRQSSPEKIAPVYAILATNRQEVLAVAAGGGTPNDPHPPPGGVTDARPFATVRIGGHFRWAMEDGRDTNVIRRLAHNDLEYERMVAENARIIRRQLVYVPETTAALVQRARLTGAAIAQLTLPGLDGQEVRFKITQADLNPSGQQGAFSGHVAGRPDSMVTLAFKGGREAFTVLSPADNLYLVGEPREPGELIVKSINPETYAAGLCGNP